MTTLYRKITNLTAFCALFWNKLAISEKSEFILGKFGIK
jgi:hypothetical protein